MGCAARKATKRRAKIGAGRCDGGRARLTRGAATRLDRRPEPARSRWQPYLACAAPLLLFAGPASRSASRRSRSSPIVVSNRGGSPDGPERPAPCKGSRGRRTPRSQRSGPAAAGSRRPGLHLRKRGDTSLSLRLRKIADCTRSPLRCEARSAGQVEVGDAKGESVVPAWKTLAARMISILDRRTV
jgi:hypothetical protein